VALAWVTLRVNLGDLKLDVDSSLALRMTGEGGAHSWVENPLKIFGAMTL